MAYDRRVDVVEDDELLKALLNAREKLFDICPHCGGVMYESFELFCFHVLVCPACGFVKDYGEVMEE